LCPRNEALAVLTAGGCKSVACTGFEDRPPNAYTLLGVLHTSVANSQDSPAGRRILGTNQLAGPGPIV
jgi:hypothetical protein